MDATPYRLYLSPTAFDHLRQCSMAMEDGQYFAFGVWSAVFLEALLAELAAELGLANPSNVDLNGRIQQLRSYNKQPRSEKGEIPDGIIKLLDELRNIRNRLVHHTGLSANTFAADADFIRSHLEVILEWYRKTRPPRIESPIEKPPEIPLEECIPVFISTITPHNHRQSYFLDSLLGQLRGIGVEPVRLIPDKYAAKDPIGKVQEKIQECQALIAVGLERSHAYFLRDREGTSEEKEDYHRWYTSGWLNLEVGVAHALGLEIFVICQRNIFSDGIFDRDFNSYIVTELKSLDEDSPELRCFLAHVKERLIDQPRDVQQV